MLLLFDLGFSLGLISQRLHLFLLVHIVLRARPFVLLGLLDHLRLLLLLLLLLLDLGCVLHHFQQLLRMLIAKLYGRFLLSGHCSVASGLLRVRYHRDSTAVRVVHVAHIVVDLQVESRLVYLDLLLNLLLASLRPSITALATAVRAGIGVLAEPV